MSDLVKLLSRETGLSNFAVRRIMQTAPLRYKVYYIPKRNGAQRRIAQPSKEVKVLQRAMVDRFLKHLPVHPAATAYGDGCSIIRNATEHLAAGPILKMDFKDFFPSIKKSDWVVFCRRSGFLNSTEEIELTANLFFQKQKEYRTLRLAIGAPSSPIISNILMHNFDLKIANAIAGTQVKFTRYADDLTFSAPRVGFLKGLQTLVRKSLRSLEYPKIKVNEDKTVIVTSKYKRVITGIVITNQGGISVGKDRRRTLRASIHRAIQGRLSELEIKQLAGMISFVRSVEPLFIEKMYVHYGSEAIDDILHRKI